LVEAASAARPISGIPRHARTVARLHVEPEFTAQDTESILGFVFDAAPWRLFLASEAVNYDVAVRRQGYARGFSLVHALASEPQKVAMVII
jgi:hypothetical protein